MYMPFPIISLCLMFHLLVRFIGYIADIVERRKQSKSLQACSEPANQATLLVTE